MDDDKKATCYYKYEIEGQEKSGQTELSEELKHPASVDRLAEELRRAIRTDEPSYFLKTPQEHGLTLTGELVGPAKIVFGWDTEFERGFESGPIGKFDFYRKDKPVKP